ncbi:MAG: hypothetical protein EOP38_22280 [Rubrivivax sp.]|nr:MAG: hypothetical protein EOP38_22280 [Rubrivivax sp.]
MRHALRQASWAAVLAGSLAGLAACSPALNWRTVQLDGSAGLQASFPCKPLHDERGVQVPGLPGPPVLMHMAACQAAQATWAVSYFDVQDVTQVSPALAANGQSLRNNLQAEQSSRAGGASSPPLTAQDLGDSAIPGMTPNPQAKHWRLLTQRPDDSGAMVAFEVHAWHFSHGLKVFQATLWRPVPPADANDSTESVETFAQGFKFSG